MGFLRGVRRAEDLGEQIVKAYILRHRTDSCTSHLSHVRAFARWHYCGGGGGREPTALVETSLLHESFPVRCGLSLSFFSLFFSFSQVVPLIIILFNFYILNEKSGTLVSSRALFVCLCNLSLSAKRGTGKWKLLCSNSIPLLL